MKRGSTRKARHDKLTYAMSIEYVDRSGIMVSAQDSYAPREPMSKTKQAHQYIIFKQFNAIEEQLKRPQFIQYLTS